MQFVARQAELLVLENLTQDGAGGRGGALVVLGEAGIGKSTLVDTVTAGLDGWLVLRADGTEFERDLPYAALHQLCTPVIETRAELPAVQRQALEAVFGLADGAAPSPLMVGLAVLGLLNELTRTQPVCCVIDDVQWIDAGTRQVLSFVARRLSAERIAVILAGRPEGAGFGELPQLPLSGLDEKDAQTLLRSTGRAGLDGDVLDRILAEARGNPLALLEFGHDADPLGLPGSPGPVGVGGSGGPLELGGSSGVRLGVVDALTAEFTRRIRRLPEATQTLLALAAAEPAGNLGLLRRAANHLRLKPSAPPDGDPALRRTTAAEDNDRVPHPATGVEDEGPVLVRLTEAEDDGLVVLGPRLRFRHPLVRSAAYQSVTPGTRRSLHAALAAATDATRDPDRRAWHRAHAVVDTDEEVADELAQAAERSQLRGDLASAAAFLERAATLTPARPEPADQLTPSALEDAAAPTPGGPDQASPAPGRLEDTASPTPGGPDQASPAPGRLEDTASPTPGGLEGGDGRVSVGSREGGRLLAAAGLRLKLGAFAEARELISQAERRPLAPGQRADAHLQLALIELYLHRSAEATAALVAVAPELGPDEAREAYLEAFISAMFIDRMPGGLRDLGDRIRTQLHNEPAAERPADPPRPLDPRQPSNPPQLPDPRQPSNPPQLPGPRQPSDSPELPDPRQPSDSPAPADVRRPVELLLDALLDQARLPVGEAVPAMRRAVEAFRTPESPWWMELAVLMALDLRHDEATAEISSRQVELARRQSAFAILPQALKFHALGRTFFGRFDEADASLAEANAVDDAAGTVSLAFGEIILAAWRGDADQVAALRAAQQDRVGRDELVAELYADAVLRNGLGEYAAALEAALAAQEQQLRGSYVVWPLDSELVEAAVRAGQPDAATHALNQLEALSRTSPTPWAVATYRLAQALTEPATSTPSPAEVTPASASAPASGSASASGGASGRVEGWYREAIDLLGRTEVRAFHGRARLLYGEWLRREGRRAEARVELQAAYEGLSSMGAVAFAERAARELSATGQRPRREGADPLEQLTAQERLIATKVAGGATSKEVAATLFLSPRTIDTHLRNIYRKLDLTSRRQLRDLSL